MLSTDTPYAKLVTLVVDDHETMALIIKSLLQQIGFDYITTAEDGVIALDRLTKKKFDLVISDWNMPNMDGLELLKLVRNSPLPGLRTIPFILLTAGTKAENIIAAKEAGVSNYIAKPVTLNVLKDKIDRTLGFI